MNEQYQELFEHMRNDHGVILLESELQEIISIVERIDTDETEIYECGCMSCRAMED